MVVRTHLVLALGALAVACTSFVDGAATNGASGNSGVPGSSGAVVPGSEDAPISQVIEEHCSGGVDPGRVLLHRLNRYELKNTLFDLTGITFASVDDFPADESAAGFDNQASALALSTLHVEKYFELAKEVAASALASPEARARIVVGDSARDSLVHFTRRAYRRAVTDAEIDSLLALFDEASAAGSSFDDALAVALRAVLASPSFVFHEPVAAVSAPAVQRLDGFALASRLSYFLWSSLPDDTLLDAAQAGELDTSDGVLRAAERLLADPRAARFVENFAGQWLDLRALPEAKPDPALFPEFDVELQSSMAQESYLVFGDLLASGGDFEQLLDGRYTFLNARLATHYGIAGNFGSDFQRVDLSGSERVGFLTQGAFLTQTSHPDRTSLVRRGKWVLEQLLCSPPPPPPANVGALPADDPSAPADASLREQVEAHRADPACSGCHASIDPIGFGLEHFDAIGRFRADDDGHPIDARGELATADGSAGAFDGAVELSDILARDPRMPVCVAQKVFTYALSRAPSAEEACVLEALAGDFVNENRSLPKLVASLATSPAFTGVHPEATAP